MRTKFWGGGVEEEEEEENKRAMIFRKILQIWRVELSDYNLCFSKLFFAPRPSPPQPNFIHTPSNNFFGHEKKWKNFFKKIFFPDFRDVVGKGLRNKNVFRKLTATVSRRRKPVRIVRLLSYSFSEGVNFKIKQFRNFQAFIPAF